MELDFYKIKFCVKLENLKIEFYVYFQVEFDISNVKFHLNLKKKKKLMAKICIELDIVKVEFQKQGHLAKYFEK